MHSRCLSELEQLSAQHDIQGQVGLDDGAMTHWRPDKRAHRDGLDDNLNGLNGTAGRAAVNAPHPIEYATSRDTAVYTP